MFKVRLLQLNRTGKEGNRAADGQGRPQEEKKRPTPLPLFLHSSLLLALREVLRERAGPVNQATGSIPLSHTTRM